MKTISLCRICKKPTNKSSNAFYCKECEEVLYKYGARRYKITKGVYVWIRGSIKRAVVNGEDVTPINECYEVID